MVAAKHHVKDEDGVPCYIYKMPKQMLVKVGSGSSADTFQLKGAEWADVKAGSHDAAVRAAGSQPSEIRGHRCRSSFNTIFGKAMREKAPLAKGTPVRVPQMLSLTK